uniref:serine C-palmitoyltransferase n=1 Tax=Lotharella globosa TaxID=91324 RepID=A0A7S3Z7V4_9EUKA|mmetsp:Transcript_2508/g.4905  ORF Transcript_2508/g.4905 Transcript_2508/m.4905 type:complete len:1328 (+) Transcript_2508:95-4078(+)
MDYKDYQPFPGYSVPAVTGHTFFTTAQWTGVTIQSVFKNAVNIIKGIPDFRTNDPEGLRLQLPMLFRTKQGVYIRLLYATIEDTFNRPIASEPADWIDCIIREYDQNHNGFMPPLRLTNRTKRCLNLGSYNYLGFGGVDKYPNATQILRDAVTKLPITTASPSAELGYHRVHRELEVALAKFLGKEDCMIMGMGFATNSTVLPALVGKGDLIVSDQLNHTSIVQGARESGAKIKPFIHNDVADLERVLQDAVLGPKKYGKILLVVEGIYSMEGDMAKLKEILPVAKRYGAYVYLDEAHSIGAIGPSGRGVTDELGVGTEDIDIMMGTFSKSFGASGGYIAGKKHVVDHVRRFAAGATDAASMPPACAVQILQALKMISGADGTDIGAKKLKAIRDNSIFFRRRLEEMGFEVLGEAPSPVIPVMLYTPTKIGDFSRMAFKRGLAVVTVGAPAVPLMYGRIRFCISAAHKHEDLVNALKIIDELGDELHLKYRAKHMPNPRFPGTLDSTEEEREKEAKKRAIRSAARRAEALSARAKITWNPLVEKPAEVLNPFGWADRKIATDARVVLSSWDYLGMSTDPNVQAACVDTLAKKGLGSCGPRGFYGTYPEHLKAERDIAAFLNTEEGILYPFGACTVSSVISCMATRGDILIVDEGVGRNVLTGVSLSRAEVHFYKHCDAEDCERVLKKLASDEWKNLGGVFGPKPRRKFLITEAIFGSNGNLAPVDKLAELRLKYRCRFILDESHSFGTLGETGRGATEHFGIGSSAVDVICGSLEGAGASCCGFSTGATGVVAYQRLLGSGYCFSASAPPYLATSISAAIRRIRMTGATRLKSLRSITKLLRKGISAIPGLRVSGSPESPMLCVELDREVKDSARTLDEICKLSQARGVAICRFNNRPRIGLRPKTFSLAPALRVCGSSAHTAEDISYVLKVLGEVTAEVLGPTPRAVEKKWAESIEEEEEVGSMPVVDVVDLTSPTKKQITSDDGVTVPLLLGVWFFISNYRNFLNQESRITGRFIDGWLRLLGLDRNSMSPTVRSFYASARVAGSHSAYSLVLPVIFWVIGGPAGALPFIFYSLVSAAGCMLKCAMSQGPSTKSWPSITCMNAVALPFFFIRFCFGEKWLIRNFSALNLIIGGIAILWVVVISLSRMEIGDAPSNIVGGMIGGSFSIHVMLLWTPAIVAFLEGEGSFFTPPIIMALGTLLMCPLPNSNYDFAVGFYRHASNHVIRMSAFLIGAMMFPHEVVAYDSVAQVATKAVLGICVFTVCQLLSVAFVRNLLAAMLTTLCSVTPHLRTYSLPAYRVLEPALCSAACGFVMSTAVPVALRATS